MLPANIVKIIKHFRLDDTLVDARLYGEGHIHDTYLVETSNHHPDYILQKINHNVFRDIPAMMENIETVTKYLNTRLAGLPGHDPDLESLKLVHTKTGLSFFQDDDGLYWRMFVYIPGTVTYQKITDTSQAFEAGKIIGSFQAMLAGLETSLLETIPGFHDIGLRIRQYEQAKSKDSAARVFQVHDDVCFAEKRFGKMETYYESLKAKAVVRATHNDTKLNNVLFDRHHKAICLIDLDTVMPGYVHFDYGDALRTIANTALEDETDLRKVHFNAESYRAFTEGYLREAGGFLNRNEVALLPFAPVYLTFLIGLRFLTDFLDGDVYFRITHPLHNLERARVQFRLVEEMERDLDFNF